MKKILLSALVILTISLGSRAQTNEPVDQQTSAAFLSDFAGAAHAVWQQGADFSKVTFAINGSVLFAYYKPGGELIAASRNISSSQLPLRLLIELKKDYNTYWITDLFELSVNNTTEYFVTLENSIEKKILRADGSNWEIYGRDNKPE